MARESDKSLLCKTELKIDFLMFLHPPLIKLAHILMLMKVYVT